MVAFDKILNFLDEIQDEIWENDDCNLNDLMLEFQTDYKYYGWEIKTNLLQLNFPGSSDWFYFISIPDEEMNNFKKIIDQYPIYFVDLEEGLLQRTSNNYRDFMATWFPGDERLEQFSKISKSQTMPEMIKLD